MDNVSNLWKTSHSADHVLVEPEGEYTTFLELDI